MKPIEEWALDLLNETKKTTSRYNTQLPVISDEESLEDGIVSLRTIQVVSCKRPYRLCYQCSPFRVVNDYPNDESDFGISMHEYKTILEEISRTGYDFTLFKKLFATCYTLHQLTDIAGQQKGLARARLRYAQNGQCIFPDCTKEKVLHLHRCLPGYLRGEYTEDNCVLVCQQHHPSLEKFRSKAEVLEYIEGMRNKGK